MKDMKYIKKLDAQSKLQLNELLRTSPNYRVRKRAHAILLSARRYSIDQLSNIFNVDRDTISDWISRWEEFGLEGLNDAARSGRPRKEETIS